MRLNLSVRNLTLYSFLTFNLICVTPILLEILFGVEMKKLAAALVQLAILEDNIGESCEISALRAKLYELIGRKHHDRQFG